MASSKEYKMAFQLSASMGGGFASTFSNAQSQIQQLQSKIDSLSKTQSDISAYQKQQTAIENTNSKLKMLKQQYDNIQQELEETGNKSSALKNKLLQKQNQIDKTSSSLEKQTQKLDSMGNALEEAGVDTTKLTSESERLGAEINDLKQEEMEAADGAQEFGDAGSTAFTDVGNMLAAAGIEQGIKKIYDAFMECVGAAGDFEAAMSQVEALSGASGSEMEQLSSAAQEMGATTSFTAEESANALSYMALAGWDTSEMLDGLNPILNLAAASNMDLAEASDIVTDYLTAFGLSASDASGFVDQMAYAMANSNTNTSQLGEAYKSCAATAHSLGQDVSTTTSLIMALSDAGIKGSEAGTAANAIMTRLATNTKGCADALEQYAGVSVYENGEMRSMIDILDDTAVAWADMSGEEQAALAKAVAGTSHYSAFATMMDAASASVENGTSKISEYAAALDDCSGTAQDMADTMLDNLNGKLTLLSSAFDGLKISIGSQFASQLGKLYDGLSKVISGVQNFVNAHPKLVTAIGDITAGILAATAAVVALAAAWTALKAIDVASMFTSPLGLITIAAGTVIGLIAGINSAFDEGSGEIDEYNQALSNISAADSTFASTKAEIDNEAASTQALAARLDELTSKSYVTAAEQQEIQSIVAELNNDIPGLGLSYDGLTNSINMTTDAIYAEIQAMKDQQEYEALQQELIELESNKEAIYQGVTDAAGDLSDAQRAYNDTLKDSGEIADMTTGEYIEYRGELADVQDEMSEANSLYGDAVAAQQEYDAQVKSITDRMLVLSSATSDANSATGTLTATQLESNKTQLQLQFAAQAVEEGYMDAAAAAKMYGLAEEDVTNYMTATQEQSDNVADAVAAVKAGYLDADTAAERFGLTLDEVNDGLKADYLNSVADAANNLATAYMNAYTEAYNSFSGQFELWDKVDETASTSVQDLQAALDSQISYWTNYNANLQTIADSGIDVSGIWDHITDGSTDAASAAQGLADAINSGDTQAVQDYVDSYAELETQISETSDTAATGSSEVQAAYDELQATIEAGVDGMDLTDEAMTAAENTMAGYVEGLGDGSEAGALLAADATSWMEQFNAALGCHSPSTITEESGENTMQGYIQGVEAMTPSAVAAVTSAAQQIISAFQSSMSSGPFYSAAASAMQGAISAINSLKGSLVAAARSAASAASAAFKISYSVSGSGKGYATGTKSAERGFAMVGEEGPELVFLNGGEQIVNAAETARLMKAMQVSETSPVEAISSRATAGSSPAVSSPVSVTFQIEGNASSDTIASLRMYGEEFAERVLEVVSDARADAARRAFT